MSNIVDVAEYILARQGPMSAMKLQRLCYYSQGWHLAWEGEPLFPERIEAWANGPVIPALYGLHRGMFTVHPGHLYRELIARGISITDVRSGRVDLYTYVFLAEAPKRPSRTPRG